MFALSGREVPKLKIPQNRKRHRGAADAGDGPRQRTQLAPCAVVLAQRVTIACLAVVLAFNAATPAYYTLKARGNETDIAWFGGVQRRSSVPRQPAAPDLHLQKKGSKSKSCRSHPMRGGHV